MAAKNVVKFKWRNTHLKSIVNNNNYGERPLGKSGHKSQVRNLLTTTENGHFERHNCYRNQIHQLNVS